MSKAVRCLLVVILAVIFMTLSRDVAAVTVAKVQRPFGCQSSDIVYVNCFLCGRMANDKRVYVGCCARIKFINEYCRLMLA